MLSMISRNSHVSSRCALEILLRCEGETVSVVLMGGWKRDGRKRKKKKKKNG